ncbi:MAG: hypothetical protein ACO4CZ_09075 [Planctomycetota bacterium]
MKRKRLLALAGLGLILSTFLLDWTVGTLASPLSLRPQADARRMRASMQEFGRATGLAHAPDLVLGLQGFQLRTGALGQRVGDEAGNAPDDALRILVLGDGATLGIGVADALTFAQRLGRERAADLRRVVVANGAHAFAEAPEPSALRAHWLPGFAPDVVLFCGPTVEGAPGELLRSIGAAGVEQPGFMRRVWPWLWELDRVVGGEQHADVASAPPPLAAESARARFEEAVAACREQGARPVLVDLGGAPSRRAWAEAAGVPWIDATPATEPGVPVLADRRIGLLTRLGHDRVLQRLVAGLVDAGVLAAPR